MSEPAAANHDHATVARLAARARGHKERYNAEKLRADALADELKALKAEADGLRAKADDSAATKRVEELTAELRSTRHRAAFDKLADKAGVKPGAARDDLWTASGWKADSDAVDEAALAAAVDAQREARPYLFADADADADAEPPAVEPRPGPARGRGAAAADGAKFTDDQLSDPRFSMLNFDKISAAASERRDRGEI